MCSTAEITAALEEKVPGFKPCFGGEELKRAAATLTGSLVGGGGKSPAGPTQAAEEADYHVRELVFAAKQYSATNTEGTPDYDSLYNHALVLTELANKIQPGSHEQLAFLQQACEKYEAAVQLRAGSQGALYNWGVALSELAHWYREHEKALGDGSRSTTPVSASETDAAASTKEGEEGGQGEGGTPGEAMSREELREAACSCLHLASQKYAQCLSWHPNNPQALNNWGLVLQELFAFAATPAARKELVPHAIEKFRHILRQRPDFDRGCYNLGTVFYACAQALQREVAQEYKAPGAVLPADSRQRVGREAAVRNLFTIAAQYICLAYALQPHREVYRRSLSLVKTFLPLPFLRAGPLIAPAPSPLGDLDDAWRRIWFVLDHVSLRSATSLESSLAAATAPDSRGAPRPSQRAVDEHPISLPLLSITAVRRCNDPGLPEGAAFWVSLEGQAGGVYLVAEDEESADAWVDALLLGAHIVSTRSPEALGEALSLSAHRRVSRPG